MRRDLALLTGILAPLLWLTVSTVGMGQETARPPETATPELPEISDEPRTVDPATSMPPPLTRLVTADLSNTSLGELVNWLRDELGLVVLLKRSALDEVGVLPSEPVSDRLENDPIFLVLDRLRPLKIGWYFENDILYITSHAEMESRFSTSPYTIGDLLDADYDVDVLQEIIVSTIAPGTWVESGGAGTLSVLGDVIFVRQTESIQREVQGLLTALRQHGRQTFVLDSPRHTEYRRLLEEEFSVDFRDTPLETAVRELAQMSKVDLRLDVPALRSVRVREREPMTVRLSERKLKTILQAMVMDLHLAWVLRDGVLWLTSRDEADEFLRTAVFDVRDLCRDAAESRALRGAITSQTADEVWVDGGGSGALASAKPGTLVVRNQEHVLASVLELLEAYRAALRTSKPRVRDEVDPNEVVTVYYRMHASIAEELDELIQTLVEPGTWASDMRPDAPGKVLRIASAPEWMALGRSGQAMAEPGGETSLLAARAVLIITQTRAVHDEIAKVLRRIEAGDPRASTSPYGDAGGTGMGGFGGGFFSVPSP
jgi:hypothetical protein